MPSTAFWHSGETTSTPGSGRWPPTWACPSNVQETALGRSVRWTGRAGRVGRGPAGSIRRVFARRTDQRPRFRRARTPRAFSRGGGGRSCGGLPRPGLSGTASSPGSSRSTRTATPEPRMMAAGASTSSAGRWPAASRPEAYQAWAAERSRLRQRIRTQRSWSEGGRQDGRPQAQGSRQGPAPRLLCQSNRETGRQGAAIGESPGPAWEPSRSPGKGGSFDLDLTPTGRSGEVVARLEAAVVQAGAIPTGTGRPGTLLGRPGGHHRPERGRENDAPGRPPRPVCPWPRAGAGWVRASSPASWTSIGPAWMPARICWPASPPPRGCSPSWPGPPWPSSVSGPVTSTAGPPPCHRVNETRALLAVLMASGTNCLVFDEPTNRLDLPAIEAAGGRPRAIRGNPARCFPRSLAARSR